MILFLTHSSYPIAQCLAAVRIWNARVHRAYTLSTGHTISDAHRSQQGRAFAWQEAQLALITIFQRFDLVMRDPSYELEVKQTLTIKPDNFYIHAIPRTDRKKYIVPISTPSSTLLRGPGVATTAAAPTAPVDDGKTPMYVLYGSNTGTSEAFAQRIASDAAEHGQLEMKFFEYDAYPKHFRFQGDNRYP